MPQDTGIAVLAGGEGSRLGYVAKGKLVYHGRRLLDRLLDMIKPLRCDTALIVKNPADYSEWSLPCYTDMIPGKAPILGIYTALSRMNKAHVLVLAVDLPGLTTEFLAYMLSRRSEGQIVIPCWNGNWESLCSIYSRELIPRIHQMITSGLYKQVDLLKSVSCCAITGDKIARFGDPARLFRNINTPADILTPDDNFPET